MHSSDLRMKWSRRPWGDRPVQATKLLYMIGLPYLSSPRHRRSCARWSALHSLHSLFALVVVGSVRIRIWGFVENYYDSRPHIR